LKMCSIIDKVETAAKTVATTEILGGMQWCAQE